MENKGFSFHCEIYLENIKYRIEKQITKGGLIMVVAEQLSKNLKYLRGLKGWTQEEMAGKIRKGLSGDSYRKWEDGTSPGLEDLLAISQIFDISINHLCSVELDMFYSYILAEKLSIDDLQAHYTSGLIDVKIAEEERELYKKTYLRLANSPIRYDTWSSRILKKCIYLYGAYSNGDDTAPSVFEEVYNTEYDYILKNEDFKTAKFLNDFKRLFAGELSEKDKKKLYKKLAKMGYHRHLHTVIVGSPEWEMRKEELEDEIYN
jgi:transcriptional regulator with XRE-family HTH domain